MLYYTEICIKYKTEKTKKEQFNNYSSFINET